MDTPQNYHPNDRRPIPQRDRPLWRGIAGRLASAKVSPNAISVAGMACCLLAGGALVATTHVETPMHRVLWLVAAPLVILRLICNMLDGMVAVARNVASPVGELYNEIPDRVSDMAALVGLGFAMSSSPVLGAVAAGLAVLTAYIRAAAKVAGAPQDYRGPMAKPQRMWVVAIVCVYMGVAAPAWHAVDLRLGFLGDHRVLSVPQMSLWVVIVGCVITCFRRTAGAAAYLSKSAGAPTP